jgi:hypothetical protein
VTFYKTVIQVEVLSEDQPVNDLDLKQIAHEIYEGDCVGASSIVSVKELTGQECADALHELGSEPEFFNLDDDGKDLFEDN